MNDIINGIFYAPLATILIIAGILFLLVAVLGNISGKIEPGTKGRVISGIIGLTFIVLGLSLHFMQQTTDILALPSATPAQKQSDQVIEKPQKLNDKNAKVPSETSVSAASTERRESQSKTVAATSEEIIEAGCSFSASHIQGEPSSTHIISCPAGCADLGYVWGTDIYTGDSTICMAAIHAGLINPQGGSIRVILEKGRPAYRGSTQHKIRSRDFGKYSSSFRLAPLTQ